MTDTWWSNGIIALGYLVWFSLWVSRRPVKNTTLFVVIALALSGAYFIMLNGMLDKMPWELTTKTPKEIPNAYKFT